MTINIGRPVTRLLILLLLTVTVALQCLASPLMRTIPTSDRLVNAIYHDSKGYLWLGTGQTLDRFDGVRVKSYEIPGDNSHLKRVNAITEDSSGNLLVGTSKGLFILSPGSALLERVAPDRIDCAVNTLVFHRGTVYAGTQRGLFSINIKKKKIDLSIPSSDSLSPLNNINSIIPDGNTGLWLTTDDALMHYNFTGEKFKAYRDPSLSTVFLRLCRAGDTIYIGTRGLGVVPFDIKTSRFGSPVTLGNNIITSLSTDGHDTLYASTDGGGIYFYSISRRDVTRHLGHNPKASGDENSLASNSVYSLLVDPSGLIWAGYYQAGAEYTPDHIDIFEIYRMPGIFDSSDFTVRSLAVNGTEKIIGTRDGFFYIDEKTGISTSFHTPQIRSNIIFSVERYEGEYYIGTYDGGMYVFNPSTLSLTDFHPEIPNPFKTGAIFATTTDKSGNLWVGTSRGVYKFHGNRLSAHYNSSNSHLPAGNVYEIFFDSKGRGWFCTENGIAVYRDGILTTDRFPKGFVHHQKIRDIIEDRSGNLYFIPDRGYPVKSNLELSRFEEIRLPASSATPSTYFAVEDNDGHIWFGTDNGMVHYDRQHEFQVYNRSYGMLSPIFTHCKPIVDDHGDLWFGNTRGLIRLDYNRFKTHHPDARKISVTDIEAGGKSIFHLISSRQGKPYLLLRDNSRSFIVRFSDMGYTQPEDAQYEYMLTGYDTKWRMLDGKSEVFYYDIPTGTYTMRIRKPGSPSTETELTIRVAYSLTLFEWVLIIMLLTVAGIAGWLYYQHKRNSASLSIAQEISGKLGDDSSSTSDEDTESKKYRTTRVSDEECKRLLKNLDNVMKNDKPYINPDLKSNDLARLVSTSSYVLSYIFNQYLKSSYYDYVNKYRVEEFKRLVHTLDPHRYTLTALSQMCGFSSRASFFRHFKKLTGITPAEYLKQEAKNFK